ncbi:SMP-30/gluconolactonase/LRE family protein [Testudinibacter sp. TR-2022]|uniref:SMP-30/gluconolactonase/LRE family protein n=1 Tax=Testudinibacter sp. TR-2022 TaxID=2585029 RepID=UPI001119DBFB|nr:SMP-30/gluconolactonase/LRE family protein [Testudinibacter sp. TR-2022]TNH05182.1 SMP-30/gluconolactonase/LRE family protein [Pasteurellaceae bacterium Phil31]TNH10479.1 SMP-30/gluconolactonase/LRE family protein [Testudinibacter sp. TR-2022]TNH10950.1 SMP-30/gluconolactonase/LRE family protein [Testudinibacter sp. TR-2022]TNH13800.1 SMP-30/gluconolactonase/LRE family protein [Testudinibacter sp. TR-2022]TNH18277.1 SMP-30/gluconolactonase/LRE family protein [Testudinibacter sp. TR-2022]
MTINIYDSAYAYLFDQNTSVECLFTDAVWAEGPVWLPDESAVIFSDVKGNKMFKWHEKGTEIFRSPSDFANGNALWTDGSLLTCQHGSRSLSHTDKQGKVSTLVDHYDGRRFNSPNDLVVKSDGTVWFTDPPYGILSNDEGYQAASEIIGCYIYCYCPQQNQTKLATFNTMRPNGLFFSPDEKTLYVADMSGVEFSDGLHHLVAFDVNGCQLSNRRTICEINPGIPDGFCVDQHGLIYCSCADGVLIITPQGKIVAKITLGKTTSNCTLGGKAQNQLFITADNCLFRVRLNTKGFQYNAFD